MCGMKKTLTVILTFVGLFVLLPYAFASGSATLTWNSNTESDLAGYKIYYGTASRGSITNPPSGYTNVIDLHNTSTSYTINNLADGTYYFAVTAYDTSNNESAYSAEVSKTINATAPPILSNGSPSGSLSAGTTKAILSVTTNESATCKYSTTPNTDYNSITNTFSTTGGTTHSSIISGLVNGSSYSYYVRCQDNSGNADTSDYQISFSVASANSISGKTFYISDSGSDSNTGYNISYPWLTINKFILYPGAITPSSGTPTSTNRITINNQVQINLRNGAVITIPANTVMTAGSTIDFSQLMATSTVSTSDIPSNYSSLGAISFGHPSYPLSTDNSVVIRIPVNFSYNDKTLSVFAKEPGNSSWADTGKTCMVLNSSCQFSATQFSQFAAVIQNSSSNTNTNTNTNTNNSIGAGTYVPSSTSIAASGASTSQPAASSTASTSNSSTAATSSSISSSDQTKLLIINLINELKSLLSQYLSMTNTTLKLGSRGADVGMLQNYLILENTGFYSGLLSKYGVTGYFGAVTRNALSEFQKSHHIYPSFGVFGPITKSYLRNNAR